MTEVKPNNIPLDDSFVEVKLKLDADHSPADQSTVVLTQPSRPKKITRVTLNMPFDDAHCEKEWSSGLFDCRKDERRSCCFQCCCWSYLRYTLATRLGETPFMAMIPCTAFGLRVKVRSLFSLKGTLVKDFFSTLCCEPCAICQMSRELDDIGL
ncbi:PLAC8-like protein 1 [Patella vulgata]|uniref:PLAC8-like protein 1 n=1 Tax=Patella vulgata TaxID=6465 RepID=UPI00217F3461|nr:PLAC8-like protein 1 [Patella vulgata]